MVLSTTSKKFSVGGQCKCKPYITGKKCDKCVEDAYGIAPNCKGMNSHKYQKLVNQTYIMFSIYSMWMQ